MRADPAKKLKANYVPEIESELLGVFYGRHKGAINAFGGENLTNPCTAEVVRSLRIRRK
jgi:hypothetical protein